VLKGFELIAPTSWNYEISLMQIKFVRCTFWFRVIWENSWRIKKYTVDKFC